MRSYIIRRLLLMVPTVFFVTLIIFLTIRLIPGSIVDVMVANYGMYGTVTEAGKEAIKHALGMDVPLIVQYGRWLSQVIHGNLGIAMWKQVPVLDEIGTRWSVTVELALMAIVIAQVLSIPIGIYSALRQNSWGDYLGRTFSILCIAVPTFWVATLVIVYPAIWWRYMPPLTLIRFQVDPIGNLKMFIVPAIVLGMGFSGMTTRLTRTMMLEVMRQDYIRTAWSKGLRERTVVVRHALKNVLIPIITVIGGQLANLIGGAVVIESIFNLPGLGLLTINSISNRDYVTIEAVLLLYAIVLVFINLLTDLTYGFLDPRIHYN